MLHNRVVLVLTLSGSKVVKTRKFSDPVYIGDPVNLVKIYNDKQVDELIILDIDSSSNSLSPDLSLIERIAKEAFMPVAYGGGITTTEVAQQILSIGIEKVIINSAILDDFSLITRLAELVGSSSVVCSIDIKRDLYLQPSLYSYKRKCIVSSSPVQFSINAVNAGAGELFVNSVDNDGMMSGYDLNVIHEVSSAVSVPIIACGGAGSLHDLSNVYYVGGSAAAVSSLFVFSGKHKAVLPSYPSSADISKLTTNYSHASIRFPYKFNVPNFKECSRCVMNNIVDPDLAFDAHGLCNHCQRNDRIKKFRLLNYDINNPIISGLVDKIKTSASSSDYDCLIGISGGVDSTYLAYLISSLGLKPLAIHLDNGWNSELATLNIENITNKLGIDLITHVLDWEQFSSLQKSFLLASVPDGEVPTDHAIFASLWNYANQYNIKYIISGMNYHTESMLIPSWSYGHSDWKYIQSVHNSYSKVSLTSYPHFTPRKLLWLSSIKKIRSLALLNYLKYDKDVAQSIITKELAWRPYGGKHHESIYTRFFQGYYLPAKFGIDKRYAHCSDLINSGQMTRSQAMSFLLTPTYDSSLQKQDIDYVKSRLQISDSEFNTIMSSPSKSYLDFPNNRKYVEIMRSTVNNLRQLKLYPN
ncbi:histidine biosynthesis protein fused to N-acetyl sugar amidotransferase domain [Synechococcus sp. BOUM118]|nr:histidine biosynthesis protein fused to N-acetyl sugar amidotransferase domain [Synechococcus sp. BOUM118]